MERHCWNCPGYKELNAMGQLYPMDGWLQHNKLAAAIRCYEGHSTVLGLWEIPYLFQLPLHPPSIGFQGNQVACNGKAAHSATTLSAEHAKVRQCVHLCA